MNTTPPTPAAPATKTKLNLYMRAEEAWNAAYDRALNSDKKMGRPYDRHRYARIAHNARAKVLGVAR